MSQLNKEFITRLKVLISEYENWDSKDEIIVEKQVPKEITIEEKSKLLTSEKCFKLFGDPSKESSMVIWDVPNNLEIGAIPKRIYCNKLLVKSLEDSFRRLVQTGCVAELKTWDGCFNIRAKRGSNSYSLHSWGLAIDINASWNPMGKPGKFSKEFVECFTDNGFDWGGYWKYPDAMHFQLKDSLVA